MLGACMTDAVAVRTCYVLMLCCCLHPWTVFVDRSLRNKSRIWRRIIVVRRALDDAENRRTSARRLNER